MSTANKQKNIFIAGADPHNLELLRAMPGAENLRFHDLFDLEDMHQGGDTRFDSLLDRADRRLRAFEGSIDAIIGYWDFPASSLIPILTSRFGTPGASRDSMLKCEHKYWSRLEQNNVIPEVCPPFCAVDPFDENAADTITVEPPYWIKPIKSTSSYLSFLIHDRKELDQALEETRGGIESMGNAFDQLLDHVFLPPDVRDVTGLLCLVEISLSGRQCTVSGYVFAHQVEIYGLVDSLSYPDTHSFQRYQIPSRLPEEIRERLFDMSRTLMSHIGYNDAPFNIEFFVDGDDIGLLEVNPRISQSHGHIYDYVDGAPNHKVMVDLALGRKPDHTPGAGEYAVAAKWFHKNFENAHVDRVPTSGDVEKIEAEFPGVAVEIVAEEDTDLADMDLQDAYSYELAHIHAGADSNEELERKVRDVIDRLPFEFSEPRAS